MITTEIVKGEFIKRIDECIEIVKRCKNIEQAIKYLEDFKKIASKKIGEK